MVRTAEKNRQYERVQVARRRAILNNLKAVPCADCGSRYPSYVMHFDHRDGEAKLFNIAHYVNGGSLKGRPFLVEKIRARGVAIEVLLAEVAKCDVVCANCHAERTWGNATSK